MDAPSRAHVIERIRQLVEQRVELDMNDPLALRCADCIEQYRHALPRVVPMANVLLRQRRREDASVLIAVDDGPQQVIGGRSRGKVVQRGAARIERHVAAHRTIVCREDADRGRIHATILARVAATLACRQFELTHWRFDDVREKLHASTANHSDQNAPCEPYARADIGAARALDRTCARPARPS